MENDRQEWEQRGSGKRCRPGVRGLPSGIQGFVARTMHFHEHEANNHLGSGAGGGTWVVSMEVLYADAPLNYLLCVFLASFTMMVSWVVLQVLRGIYDLSNALLNLAFVLSEMSQADHFTVSLSSQQFGCRDSMEYIP